MDPQTRRELRLLKGYAAVSSLLLVVLCVGAFARSGRTTRFEQIDVERINVVETDGTVRLVISNRGRFPGIVMDHKEYSAFRSVAGIIFYNDEGDEQGGLTYSGYGKGGSSGASGVLTFDRYKQDQVLGLQYIDENGRGYAGLSVWDRPAAPQSSYYARREQIIRMPEGPAQQAARDSLLKSFQTTLAGTSRLFVGRDRGKNAAVDLKDPAGRVRLRLVVDSLGAPQVQFLDARGQGVYLLPDSARVRR